MIVCVQGGVPCLSLYRGRRYGTYLVLVGYNREVLILLHNLAFPCKPTRSIWYKLEVHTTLFHVIQQVMGQPKAHLGSDPIGNP
jgi:hypothetical protein